MEYKTARNLAEDLDAIGDVNMTQLVHFDNRGGLMSTPISKFDDIPDDDLYGVEFYAHDMYIPKEVIDTVSGYECGGIITDPDIGVVAPRQE